MNLLSKYLLVVLSVSLHISEAQGQGVITTIAGNGITQYIGDGSPAKNFSLGLPKSIYIDKKGKMYIADNANNRIRTLFHDTLRTIVGDTVSDDLGDGGLAAAAKLRQPVGINLDTFGNVYITEEYNNIIRKIDAQTGIIHTVCGVKGSSGFGGDGGLAILAHLATPGGACTDRAGNIYIPDYGNNRIRKVTIADGFINTIAGTGVNGYGGDGFPATNAILSYPNSIFVDTIGNVYFSEMGNNTIRRIDAVTGIITTIVGTGVQGFSPDGTMATSAKLSGPNSVFVDNHGIIYISDFNNDMIRAILPTGIIHTIAGNGFYGYTGDNGVPLNATMRGPTAVATDDSGYIYIADGFNSVIRKVTPIASILVGVEHVEESTPFMIYPNPSDGKFTVITEQPFTEHSIQVFNALGQVIYTTKFTSNRNIIDLSMYPSGVYFVHYISPQNNSVRKIVIR
jgi:sugar lactone lactonase YvrE